MHDADAIDAVLCCRRFCSFSSRCHVAADFRACFHEPIYVPCAIFAFVFLVFYFFMSSFPHVGLSFAMIRIFMPPSIFSILYDDIIIFLLSLLLFSLLEMIAFIFAIDADATFMIKINIHWSFSLLPLHSPFIDYHSLP